MKKSSALPLALALSLAQLIMETLGMIGAFRYFGLGALRYYTELSNLFGLITSLLYTLWALKALREGGELPLWVRILRYCSACCLTLTFLVVIFVLCPMGVGSYSFMLLSGHLLFNHTLCPIISVIAVLFDAGEPLPKRAVAFSMIPTLLYAVVTVILNIVGVLYGPYPFLHVYEQSLGMSFFWAFAIIGGAYAIFRTLWALSVKIKKRA